MECPEAVDAISNGDVVSVDADAGTITDETTGETFTAQPFRRSSWRSSTREASCPAGRRSSERTRSMTTTYKICLLAGDGIGPEIIAEGVKVLDAVGAKYDTAFRVHRRAHRRCGHRRDGQPCRKPRWMRPARPDAVLLAAVGGPKWDTTDPNAPATGAKGSLGIRKELGLYTNLRPADIQRLADASTLRPEIVDGVDMMIVRELTGGLYFGAASASTTSRPPA